MPHRIPADDLLALARAAPQDRDATLLRATTALFCQEATHDRDSVRRFEQLATHFLPKASERDRAYVAVMLAGRSDAPSAVMRLLARDVIAVAGPVLRQSTALSTIDLLGVIAVTGHDHHRLIAARQGLPPEVLRALYLTGEQRIRAALDRQPEEERRAIEETIPVSAPALAATAEVRSAIAAARAPAPVAAVPARLAGGAALPRHQGVMPPTETTIAAMIRQLARVTAPATPTAASDADAAAPAADGPRGDDAPLDEFLDLGAPARLQMIGTVADSKAPPSNRPLDKALRQAFAGAQIVVSAKTGDRDGLIRAFAEVLDLDPSLVQRLVFDPSGEPLVLMLKAAALAESDARTVLLLANPAIGQSVERFFRLADLHATVEPAVAESFVAAWRDKVTTPTYQPYHAETGKRPRAAERPAVSSPAARQVVQPWRRAGEST